MSDQEAPPKKLDLHIGNIPHFVAHALQVPRALVITQDADGVISMASNGVNHAVANEMLSVGIYSNLDQHYSALRDGLGGQELREQQQAVDALNKEGGVQ
ncbi:hypothetical protein [Chitinimonas naiadis]